MSLGIVPNATPSRPVGCPVRRALPFLYATAVEQDVSNEPSLRRADKLMTEGEVDLFLRKAYCGRLATMGHDGFPYICPLLFVWDGAEIWLHGTSHAGHLQTNVRNRPQVCFEVDEPGEVFAYGRFECDTGLAYRSVVAFGSARIVESIAD